MEFNEYQAETKKTAVYPNIGNNVVYPTLGLVGEAGEVAEKVKKVLRDGNGIFGYEQREAIIKELGDVLWYIARVAAECDYTLEYVAQSNLQKLRDRQARNVLHGAGDSR